MATYTVTFLQADGRESVTIYGRVPSNYQLCATGSFRGAQFAARYWPSRKCWRLIDMRHAQRIVGNFVHWIGFKWLDVRFPSEEAAMMYARHFAAIEVQSD